jgi:hypothetical protein
VCTDKRGDTKVFHSVRYDILVRGKGAILPVFSRVDSRAMDQGLQLIVFISYELLKPRRLFTGL